MSGGGEEQEEEPAGLSDGRLTGIPRDFIRLGEEQKERERLLFICTKVWFTRFC